MRTKDYTRPDIKSKGVSYYVRLVSGDWTNYLSQYEGQKLGPFDTDDCWDMSVVSYVLEVQLNYEMRMGHFTADQVAWFQNNGYLDSNNLFSISERFYAILSKHTDQGNDPWMMAYYIETYGFLPRADLDYSLEQANKWESQQQFDADYFNPAAVTSQMMSKAKQAGSYINVQPFIVGEVGTSPDLQLVWAAIKQCPVVYAVPVPEPSNLWNVPVVPYQGGVQGNHCVGGYKISDQYDPNNPSAQVPIPIGDNYIPEFKVLQAGYFLAEVVAILITSAVPQTIPLQQNANDNSVFGAVFDWFTKVMNQWFVGYGVQPEKAATTK